MFEYTGKNVILMLCSKCNVKCKHCYVRFKGEFKSEDLVKIVTQLRKKYFVILNGTEPILYPEYYEVFRQNEQHRILTNGLELMRNKSVREKLLSNGIDEIALSYHFGMQDDISYVKEEWLDILIRELKEQGFRIKLMTTISADNYKKIDEMCRRAYELGANTIKFTNYIYQGNARDLAFRKVLNSEQIDEVLEQIDRLREEYLPEELYIERCGTFGPNRERRERFECLAGKNTVVITPELKVYQCVFDIEPGNEIGYYEDGRILLEDRMKDIDTSYCKVLKKYNNVNR